MLGYERRAKGQPLHLSSHIAERARNARALMLVVNMMGENVETVRRHYFNFDHEVMARMIEDWSSRRCLIE